MAPMAKPDAILVAVRDPDWAIALSCGIRSGHRVVRADVHEALNVARQLRPGLIFVGKAEHIAALRGQSVVFVQHIITSAEARAAIELGAYATLDTMSEEWPTKLRRIIEACVAKGRLVEPAVAPVLRLVPRKPRTQRASK